MARVETTVVIGCPVCGRQYRYDTGRFGCTGIRVRCRSCETVMRIEIPASLLAVAGSGAAPTATGTAAEVPPPTWTPDPDPPSEPRVLPVARSHDPAPRRALVAEREPDLRRLLAGVLTQCGYVVEEVDDGESARRAVLARRPDLAVLDVFLPRILGVTLCVQMKRHPQLAGISVLLVGSQYRRERFVRDPNDVYGADGFIDANGAPESISDRIRIQVKEVEKCRRPEAPAVVEEREDVARLARIVAGDIILYNPERAEREIAEGRFFDTFAAEIREGEALVSKRFAHLQDGLELFRESLRSAVAQHRQAAGLAAPVGGR